MPETITMAEPQQESTPKSNGRKSFTKRLSFTMMKNWNDGSSERRPSLLRGGSTKRRPALVRAEGMRNLLNATELYDRERRASSSYRYRTSTYEQDLSEVLRIAALVEAEDAEEEEELIESENIEVTASGIKGQEEEEDEETKEPEEEDENHHVHFDTVMIYEHPIIIGDHPGVHGGVPLTIAWNHTSELKLDFQHYESTRENNRRKVSDMKISSDQRDALLDKLGFPITECQQARQEAAKISKSRLIAKANVNKDDELEKQELFHWKIHNILSWGKLKRQQREMEAYLQKYVPSYNKSVLEYNLNHLRDVGEGATGGGGGGGGGASSNSAATSVSTTECACK